MKRPKALRLGGCVFKLGDEEHFVEITESYTFPRVSLFGPTHRKVSPHQLRKLAAWLEECAKWKESQ